MLASHRGDTERLCQVFRKKDGGGLVSDISNRDAEQEVAS